MERAATIAYSLEAEQDSVLRQLPGMNSVALWPLLSYVLDLEEAKTAQAKEIASLKKRVKQLEKIRKSRTSELKRLRMVGSASRVESFNDVSEEVVVEKEVGEKEVSVVDPATTASEVATTTNATTVVDELTLAQTLIEIKAAKLKAVTTAATTITTVVISTRLKSKGIIFHDQEEQAHTSTHTVSSSQSQVL
ncbi:hypothetical protein Tco_0741329 [Tanacetum coccineum]